MKLIQTKDYLLLIDEEKYAKIGDFITDSTGIEKVTYFDTVTLEYSIKANNSQHRSSKNWLKIIASFPEIEGLPLLPNPFKEKSLGRIIREAFGNDEALDENEKQARYNWGLGYKTAKEQYSKQYSLEDMKKAIEFGLGGMYGYLPGKEEETEYQMNLFIQSLSTPKAPVSFEPEYEDYEILGQRDGDGYPLWGKRLKTITNLEGKQQLVGTYKY